MPESVHWLARKQPENALEKINRTLKKIGHAAVAALPAVSAEVRKRSVGDIFRGSLLPITVIVTFAYFFHITTFYFIVKYVPTLVVDMGFAPSSAGQVLSWLNVGGATGGTVVGLLAMRYNVKFITISVMLVSTVMVTLFGRAPADLTCADPDLHGRPASSRTVRSRACTRCSRKRSRRTCARSARASRSASAAAARCSRRISPAALFAAELGVSTVSMIMALGSLFAAGVLTMLVIKPEAPEAESSAKRAPRPAPISRAPSRTAADFSYDEVL